MPSFFFSSESVSPGHPDKLCDCISDAIVDACLSQDKFSKVAAETAAKDAGIFLLGEITTKAVVDYQKIVRETVKDIGYTNAEYGIGYDHLVLMNALNSQSPEINASVFKSEGLQQDQGAGDQGLMIGYATNETENMMPLTYDLARGLVMRLWEARNNQEIKWLRPDCKTQVCVEYEYEDVNGLKKNMRPKRVDSVLISTQHHPNIPQQEIEKELREKIVAPVIGKWADDKTRYFMNPSGSFVVGGPQGDAGLTGRKIIVDTYGGWGGHGGGAFSGKDPSKVDRSAAYAARWVAKSLVAAGLCDRCVVQVAYSIGVAEPLSIFVDSQGTGKKPDSELMEIVRKNFSLTPYNIIKELDLLRPIYKQTSRFGHFGHKDFPWEVVKKLQY
jgi:S-adenosylmethionine synthetase